MTGLPSQRLRSWEVASGLVERVDVSRYCPPLTVLLVHDRHLRQRKIIQVNISPSKLQVTGLLQAIGLLQVTGLPSQRLRSREVAGGLVERVNVSRYCPPLKSVSGVE